MSRVVGLEHEFGVIAEGQAVDFRKLIHSLPIDGLRVDPSDPNAYRGAWGGSITADGAEAEIAIAPATCEPGFSRLMLAHARRGREQLVAALPPGHHLAGFSTHISVEVPDRLAEAAAKLYVRVFSPALMLLLDAPESPGLLVRPRRGRLEFCGEFAHGERLRAAIVFAVGSTLATVAALERPIWRRRRLPAQVALKPEPALERYGWYVDRSASGPDLYREGRAARLPLIGGKAVSAQQHLEAAWAVARRALAGHASVAELELVDQFVSGQRPLGIEQDQALAVAPDDACAGTDDALVDTPFADVVKVRRRNGLEIEPAIVSWDFVVLRISGVVANGANRTAFACLPRNFLGPALEALETRRLDALLKLYLSTDGLGGTDRQLSVASQTRTPGLYRSVGASSRLLDSERGPQGTGDRPGKDRGDDGNDATPRPEAISRPRDMTKPALAAAGAGALLFGIPVPIAAAAAGFLALAGLLGGVVVLGGATPSPNPAAIATTAPRPTFAASIPVPTLPAVTYEPFSFAPPIPDFTTGTATVRVTGDATGESEMTFSNEGSQGEPGGMVYPILTWSNADSTQVFGITLPQRHAVGTFSTADGTLGIGVAIDLTDPLFGTTQWYVAGAGLGHESLDALPEPCTATVNSTPTGGITGTLSCPNINDPTLVYRLEATFSAEPDTGAFGTECLDRSVYQVLMSTRDYAALTEAEVDTLIAHLSAYDYGTDTTGASWRDRFVAALSTGDRSGAQLLSGALVMGPGFGEPRPCSGTIVLP